jgi:hypothetical protein
MGKFLRNYATPLSLVGFAAIGVTGVMMFLGVRSHQLNEIHEWIGIAFVVVAILHLFRNIKSFGLMMAQTRSMVVVGVLGTVAALLIVTATFSGGAGGGQGSGGPPQFRVAERLSYTPIAQLAPAFGLSSGQFIARLRKGGVTVSGPGQNLADISQKQGIGVPRLFMLVIAEQGDSDS